MVEADNVNLNFHQTKSHTDSGCIVFYETYFTFIRNYHFIIAKFPILKKMYFFLQLPLATKSCTNL